LDDENQIVTRRHMRQVLTANRTYYGQTDGDDSNDGLADNSGGAFLTIQKAISVVAALDISIHNVTIRLEDTTWADSVSVVGPWVGSGAVTLRRASNACTISAAVCVTVQNTGSKLSLSNLTLAGTVNCIVVQNGGVVTCGANIVIGGNS